MIFTLANEIENGREQASKKKKTLLGIIIKRLLISPIRLYYNLNTYKRYICISFYFDLSRYDFCCVATNKRKSNKVISILSAKHRSPERLNLKSYLPNSESKIVHE